MDAASSNTYISKRMIAQWQAAKQQQQQPKLASKAFTEDEEMKDVSMEPQQ